MLCNSKSILRLLSIHVSNFFSLLWTILFLTFDRPLTLISVFNIVYFLRSNTLRNLIVGLFLSVGFTEEGTFWLLTELAERIVPGTKIFACFLNEYSFSFFFFLIRPLTLISVFLFNIFFRLLGPFHDRYSN